MGSKHGFISPHMRGFPFATTNKGVGVVYDADATALFARWTTQPTQPTIKPAYDAFIVGLKEDELWPKLDRLLIYGTFDAQAARQNIKQDLYNSVAVASPNFSAGLGYAGDGSLSYLASGYAMGVSAGVAAQDSNHVLVFSLTDSAFTAVETGNTNNSIGLRSVANVMTTRGMSSSGDGTAIVTSLGCFTTSRLLSTEYKVYQSGTELSTHGRASSAVVNFELYDCGRNVSGTLGAPSNRRIFAVCNGSGLTAGEVAALYERINTLKTALQTALGV